MGRLDGKVAVITGAASGIGFATALRFAEEGAAIAGLDIQKPDDAAWQQVVDTAGAGSLFHEVDVQSEASIRAAAAACIEQFGRVDVLVNAAGVINFGSAHSLEVEEWDRVLNINLRGSYLVAKHVLPSMQANRSGSIVNIASVEGLVGLTDAIAYNASKGGVVLMTKNMAIDYASQGIRVNCVCPGGVETGMTAMLQIPELAELKKVLYGYHLLGRFAKPVEIANAILFLASDEASFVTGSSLVVDGGYTAGHTAPKVGGL